MSAVTLSSITGKDGSIRIPALGALIGQMVSWTLKRRGDDGPQVGLYDFRAALSYVNPHLFNHPQYADKRVIRVRLSKNSEFEVVFEPASEVQLDGNTLTMKGVTLCRL